MSFISNKNVYQQLLRPLLFVIGLVFFVILINRSWQETQSMLRTINGQLFFASIFVAMLDIIFFSVLFQQLTRKYSIDIDYLSAGQMFFYGQVAKYIPGQLWTVFYHATFLQSPGSTKTMLFVNLDLTALSMLRTIFIAATLLVFQWNIPLALLILVIGIIGFWFFARSNWIAHIFQMVFRSSDSKRSFNQNSLSNSIVLALATLNVVTYLLANFMVMRAAFGFSISETAPYIAYLSVSWVVGVLLFIIPAGIGVRELIFVLLAQAFNQDEILSIEVLTAIAIVYRFWQILLDLGCLGLGFSISQFRARAINTQRGSIK